MIVSPIRQQGRNRWYRVDAAEIWHYYAGASLAISAGRERGGIEKILLWADLARGEQPQVVVPKGAWQSVVISGAWTLAGYSVSPAFGFTGFEMEPLGFSPEN